MPKAAKAAIWFTFCNFFVSGLSFLTGPIFTRILSPDEYGILTLYITYEQILLILATWEIYNGAFQRGLFKYEGSWGQYTQSTISLINLLTVSAFVFVLMFNGAISEFTRMPPLTLTLLFVYLITYPAYFQFLTIKRTEYDYKVVVGLSVLYSLLNIGISLAAILIVNRTAQVKYNATLIVAILFSFYFYLTGLYNKGSRLRLSEVKPQWKFMIDYQAPLVLHSLSYLVLGQADRVMIGKMVGDSQAAFYGVAYTLASAITIMQVSLNGALTPWRFQKLKEEKYELVGKTTIMIMVLLGVSILAVVLVSPEVLRVLFTPDYYEAVWSIPPISISIFFMFLYSSFVAVESYYEKTKYIMYVSVFCGLINIGLNYVLIPIFGYIVCGYTTLFSYVLFALLHYMCMKIVCRSVIPGIRIFNLKTIVLISLAVIICSVLFTILYPYWMARYFIVLFILVIGWKRRNQIAAIMADLKTGK